LKIENDLRRNVLLMSAMRSQGVAGVAIVLMMRSQGVRSQGVAAVLLMSPFQGWSNR
jgi:hypothetical protein